MPTVAAAWALVEHHTQAATWLGKDTVLIAAVPAGLTQADFQAAAA
jgi:hypothetical protein